MIHSTAIISKSAKIDSSVVIGPYSIIGDNVVISENTKLESHVVIKKIRLLVVIIKYINLLQLVKIPRTLNLIMKKLLLLLVIIIHLENSAQ